MSFAKVQESEVPERLFISALDAGSGRNAILEDDGFSVMLYLTEPNLKKVAADCYVYSVVSPTTKLVSPNGRHGPPVLMQRYATDVAMKSHVPRHDHRLEFSSDGHSVAVIVGEEPWAFIVANKRLGYSKSVSIEGPFGHPWDEELFEALFWVGPDLK